MANSSPQLAFPFNFDERGRVGEVDRDEHIRQMIELVLFTSPGERVNRPEFGCGLMQHLFQPAGRMFGEALGLNVQASLQRWLGDILLIKGVEIRPGEATLEVQVVYRVLEETEDRVASFSPTQTL